MSAPGDEGRPPEEASLELVALADRPELEKPTEQVELTTYPAFMIEGQTDYYEAMQRLGPATKPYRLVYVLSGTDQVVAGTDAAPIAWDGTDRDLPLGYDDSLRRVLDVVERGIEPSALCALNLMVSERARGMRLSVRLMEALVERASSIGPVIGAIRPPGKLQFPRAPIEEYVSRTRDDGSHFDPWVRAFSSAGARIGPTSSKSVEIVASVDKWSTWTGMILAADGEYEIPGGLGTLKVDLASNTGTYVEPSVWVIFEPRSHHGADGS